MGQILRTGVKAALARWVIGKRRGPWARPAPTPQDEATHAWDGRSSFVEDYSFVGTQAGLGVVLRLEWLPGREAQRVWVVVLRPDGVWALAHGPQVVPTHAGDRWRAGGLRLDCQTPLRQWSLRFEGSLLQQGHAQQESHLRVVGPETGLVRGSVDLTFVSEAPPHVPGIDDDPELLARRLGEAPWDRGLLRAARRAGPRGYVQPGELHGTVAVGERLIPVRAMSLRQHHWGPQHRAARRGAYQCVFATQDERRGWLHHARLPSMTLDGGFVEHRGRRSCVRSLACTTESRPGRAPARVGLSIGEPDGIREIHAQVVSELDLAVDGHGVNLALLQITGPSPGWGLWAEGRAEVGAR